MRFVIIPEMLLIFFIIIIISVFKTHAQKEKKNTEQNCSLPLQ